MKYSATAFSAKISTNSVTDRRREPHEEANSPERFDPSLRNHIWYEHWHRYHWASQISKGRNVADVACGEGYGTNLLARDAKLAMGIDYDRHTVESARRKYGGARLQFVQSDARVLPLSDNSIDLLVSFETLEHLSKQEKMIAEIARVLRSDGLAVISTPDREIYSPDGVRHNEHHVSELSASEFYDLLAGSFTSVRSFGQRFQCLSVIDEIQPTGDPSTAVTYADFSGVRTHERRPGEHVYLIAVCGHSNVITHNVPLPGWHAFNNSSDELFAHYERQIERLQAADVTLEQMRRELRECRAAAAQLAARLGY